MNTHERVVVVDIGRGHAKGFADAEPGVGEELVQRPVGSRVAH
jgi:hypothetical protein